MNIDPAQVDTVLATTRAVRKRLDLDRPVDNQLLLDCIDLAEQAPTGGNLGSRRWIVVRDRAVKEQLAEVYRDAAGAFMSTTAERLRGTGHPQEKVMASASYLVDHLADVPAIVIPTIIGRHDGGSRPGLFDSVLQAAWSFCLALRARGLGSTWVTAALQDEARVKEILGIPAHMTEVVMLPVAWTKGTEFKRAAPVARPGDHVLRPVRYHIAARGRASPSVFTDGPGIIARGRHRRLRCRQGVGPGHRHQRARPVLHRVPRGRVGGTDERGRRGHVQRAEPARRHRGVDGSRASSTLSTRVGRSAGALRIAENPGARWKFELDASVGRTRLRFSYVIGPRLVGNEPGHRACTPTRRPACCAGDWARCRPTWSAPWRASRRWLRRRDAPHRAHGHAVHRPGRGSWHCRPNGSVSTRSGCPSSGRPTR